MRSLTSANHHPLEVAAQKSSNLGYQAPGIISIVVCTGLAISLIPADPEPEGALFYSALAMTIGLAAAPLAAAWRDPKSILRGEHLLALAPIYWLLLDLLQSAYPMDKIERQEIEFAFLGIGLFAIAIWLSSCSRPWKLPAVIVDSVSHEFSPNAYFNLCVLAFILGMLKFAIPMNFNLVEMFSYLGAGRWDAPWQRGQFGGWDAFADHLAYFCYLVPALTIVVARRSGWLNVRTLISIGMSIVVTLFLAQSGSRRVVGVVIGMAMILWVLSEARLKIRHALIGIAAIGVLLAALQVMVEYRNVGLGMLLQEAKPEKEQQLDYLHVDDNFYRLSQIIQLIPDSHPYVYHQYLVWILIRPIPRVFWPNKPVDPGFDLPEAIGEKGVSLSSSVIGELYMSAGFFAVFIGGWLFGKLSGMANQLLLRSRTLGAFLVYGALVMALFTGMRSLLELVLASYAVLAWVGLSMTFTYLRGRNVS